MIFNTKKEKKQSILERIDPEFQNQLKKAGLIRQQKGLARMNPTDASVRELTNLLTKTEGWRISMEELKNKPKKK